MDHREHQPPCPFDRREEILKLLEQVEHQQPLLPYLALLEGVPPCPEELALRASLPPDEQALLRELVTPLGEEDRAGLLRLLLARMS